MMRLLLVDDEAEILDWLFELFTEQDRMPLDVYRASSGSTALALLGKVKFDIVLSDIRMPGMTGIQLMERIRVLWPACRILFLTGYSEFEYVYSAIREEHVKYLLKTEEDEVILEAVEKAAAEIEAEMRAATDHERLSAICRDAIPHLRRNLLIRCLEGMGAPGGDESVISPVVELAIDAMRPVFLVSARLDGFECSRSLRPDDRLETVVWKADALFRPRIRHESVLLDTQEIVWFLQPSPEYFPEDGLSTFHPVLTGILESLQAHVRMNLGTTMSIVLSGREWSWACLREGHEVLHSLFSHSVGFGPEILLDERSMQMESLHRKQDPEGMEPCGCVSVLTKHQLMKELPVLLERGEQASFLSILEEVTTEMRGCRSRNDPIALETYYGVATMLLSAINRNGLMERIAFRMGAGPLMRVDLHEGWNEAADYLAAMSGCIFSLMRDSGQSRMQSSIQSVCDYIAAHLGEDLSLVKLSEITWFNPSYLSRLFRQSTGQTLSDYIAGMRRDRARELLRDPSVRILDVSTAVGFDSPHYFSRFFKKMTGLTPQEFREGCRERNR